MCIIKVENPYRVAFNSQYLGEGFRLNRTLREVRVRTIRISGEKTFLARKKASTKALRQDVIADMISSRFWR